MPPEQALPMHTEQCKRWLSNSLANKRQRHASQATHSPAALHRSSATPPYKTVHHCVHQKDAHHNPQPALPSRHVPCPKQQTRMSPRIAAQLQRSFCMRLRRSLSASRASKSRSSCWTLHASRLACRKTDNRPPFLKVSDSFDDIHNTRNMLCQLTQST